MEEGDKPAVMENLIVQWIKQKPEHRQEFADDTIKSKPVNEYEELID